MQVAWRRGFFRAWVVLAIIWIAGVGWNQYPLFHLETKIQTSGDCWERFARRPDGTALDDKFELFFSHSPPPGSPPSDRDRWHAAALQKIHDCEVAEAASLTITQHIERAIEENWEDASSSLALILLPPLMLLGCGVILGWVIRGFRTAT
jgi:hypothetical protein